MLISEILNFRNRFEIAHGGGQREFSVLGTLESNASGLLTFCRDDELDDILKASNKKNIAGLFIKKKYAGHIKTDATLIFCEKPYYDFHLFHQYLYDNTNFLKSNEQNQISPTATIHPTVIIEDTGVVIGDRTKIGPGVVIHANSKIGDDVVIGAGCVIGGESLHIAYEDGKRVFISHVGGVSIGNGTYMGSNNVVIKNIYKEPNTSIGNNVAIANLSMIGHNVRVEDNVQIISNVVLGGGCVIKNGARVSFGANIANYCVVGKGAWVTIGAVVTKDVLDNTKVSGNFAIEHSKQIKHIKNISSNRD